MSACLLALFALLSLPAFGQFSGAVPDEIRRFDGAMASLVNASSAPGANTSAPAYTNSYSYSNELVLTTFMGYAGVTYNWTTAPCTGSCSSPWTGWTGTNRLDDVTAGTTAGEFSPYVNTYTESSSAPLAAMTGKYDVSTVKWNTVTLPLIPSSGSITVRTLSSSGCPSSPCNSVLSSAATSVTLTGLAGQSTGDFLYACVAYMSSNVLTAIPVGFGPISTSINSNGLYLNCYAKTAAAVDSTSISITSFTGTSGTLTFTNSGTNNLSAGTTVMLSGFTGGNSGLNGQTVTALSAGLSSTTFEATVTGSGYSSGSGTATADYVFTQSTSGAMTAFIMALANVLYPDQLLTSVSAGLAGSSQTPATPSYTTNYNGEVMLAMFTWNGSTNWSAAPTTGTNILAPTPTNQQYSVYVNYQTISGSSTPVGSVSGSYSASVNWTANTLGIIPSGTIALHTPATSAQQSDGTGTTISPSKPANEVSGDLVLACVVWNLAGANLITPPSGFSLVSANNSMATAVQTSCFSKIAGPSEPSAYTFTQVNTTRITAFVIPFGNATGVDKLPPSSTASFSSGDIGKDLCVAGVFVPSQYIPASGAQTQSCGTIGAVISSTKVIGYGVWNVGISATGMEYRYGTDNTAALQNDISNATNGLTVYLPCGGMMILGIGQPLTQITGPPTIPFNIIGCGSGSANWEGNLPIANPVAMGSEMVVASTAYTSGSQANPGALLLSANPVTSGGQCALSYHLSDFTLWGGAGISGDGGGPGMPGLKGVDLCRVLIENVEIGNFANDDAQILATTGSFGNQVTLINTYELLAGGNGLNFIGGSGSQNTTLLNNVFDANAKYGLSIGYTGSPWALNMMSNDISRNGLGEMNVATGAAAQGCDIANNYWEHDLSNVIPMINGMSLLPCRWGPQTVIYGSGAGAYSGTQPTLSGSGACATLTGQLGAPTTGGAWWGPGIGSVQCTGATTSPSTLVITPGQLATHYWNCSGSDTTSGISGGQSGQSNSSCTLKFSSVTANDVISFAVNAF